MIRKLLTIFFLIILTSTIQAYHSLPVVKSYKKETYKAGRQNWDIETDSKGVTCFANNAGLLRYVFGEWELSKTLNTDAIKSLCIQNDTVWCAGGFDYGYFVKNSPDNMEYHWIGNISTGNVWSIECDDNYIYFQTESRIIAYNKQTDISHYIEENSGFWGLVNWNNKVWTLDRLGNIGYLKGYKFIPVSRNKDILQWEIRKLFIHNGSLYILVFDGRLFKYDEHEFTEVALPNSIAGNAFFCATSNGDDKILLGSISKGLIKYNIDKNTVEEFIDTESGLLDNTVLAIGKDMNGNVWLGLDYGLAFIETQNPIKSIFEGAATYSIVDDNEYTYLATNKGLFYSNGNTAFKMVDGSDGQIWHLCSIDDDIYLCHNKGVFILKGKEVHPLFTSTGVQDIARFGESPYYVLSSYTGLLLVKYHNGKFVLQENLQIWGNPKVQYDKENDCIWTDAHCSDLMQLKLDTSNKVNQKLFTGITNYFKGENRFVFYDDNLLLTFENGAFTPIKEKPFDLIKGANITALDFDENNNFIAFVQNDYPNLLSNLHDGNFYSYQKLLSSLKNTLIKDKHFIDLHNNELRIATERGVTVFTVHTANTVPVMKSVISKIAVADNNIITSYMYPYIAEELALSKDVDGLIFHFGTNKSSSDLAEFRFQLVPFDQNWSQWSTSRTVKEYSTMKGGSYEFHLQCRLNGGEIRESTMIVNIAKHWYQTCWVLLPIVLLLSSGIVVISKIMVHRNNQKIKKEQKIHKEELATKTIEFKNEQLLQYTEVISSKNEFLNSLKDGLSRMRNADARHWENKIVDEVNKEKKNFLFHKLFSEVHQTFIKRLTDKHDCLTSNDIRIVSFIRINLGTKEIANLMNISPKSVDISRYRLRKKLQLKHDQDLNKYIREM